jgi:PadR family transcriptional regulator, regulatory protein PadR
MNGISGNHLRGHLDSMILSVVDGAEAHGFEILKRLEVAGSGALTLKEGSLYPALYRLEQSGALKARWEDDQSNRRGPRRKLYRITPKGRRQLKAGREEWKTFVSVIGGILGAAT